MLRHAITSTSLGRLTLTARDDALTGVYFPHHWNRPEASTFGALVNVADDAVLSDAAAQVAEYLAGERREFEVAAAAHGDEWQRQVWAQLGEVPYGALITYGELAHQLGDGSLAYQVGQAVGRNPLSIVVPCHRVVGKDGRLTGYAGGLRRKRALLDLERSASTALTLF